MNDNISRHVFELLRDFPKSPGELGTHRIKRVLSRLGNPERQVPSILVAGTNGKGSVAAFVENILRTSGVKTGLFTSPHLKQLTERIKINGKDVTWSELFEALLVVKEHTDKDLGLSYFEALTAAAFLIFSKQVDFSVLEVGLGGRLDATNVVDPLVSVITSISYDHQHLLGNTLEEIAFEKAGIVRRNTPAIFGTPRSLFDSYVEGLIKQKGGIPEVLGREFSIERAEVGVTYKSNSLVMRNLIVSLKGEYQYENAAIAIRTAEHLKDKGFNITDGSIRKALATTYWPARLQVIDNKPVVVVDGAHNLGAAYRLMETLRRTFRFDRCILIMASKATKDYGKFLKVLSEGIDMAIFTYVEGLQDPGVLAEVGDSMGIKNEIVYDPVNALMRAREIAGENDLILIAGSLYLAGEILRWNDEGRGRVNSSGAS